MNKTELIKKISGELGVPRKKTAEFIDCFVDSICNSLKKGDCVRIQGFGTFDRKVKATKRGVNPITKEKVIIGETIVPVFRAGKTLREFMK